MNKTRVRLVLLASVASVSAAPIDSTREVKPFLGEHCYRWGAAMQPRSGLAADAKRTSILASGDLAPWLSAKNQQVLSGSVKKQNEGASSPSDEQPHGKVHWAFLPPKHPAPPEVKGQKWPRNAIDQFILARLERERVKPSPDADGVTLLRRVSLDLTGLPPTTAEADAFMKDDSRDAYEKAIERLLDSPHYGERWGRWWLDAARYADSNGYSIDSERSIWPYRDWVVSAFNRDMSFDQFTIWQLGGDLLPNASSEQIIATGFHRNTQVNHEGGIDLEQFRVESAVDRVNTTATVWLGLTLACAQCHDHKFDPITQREYYRFFAFFNQQENDGHGDSALEAINSMELGTPEQLAELSAYRRELKTLQKDLDEWLEKELKPKRADWEQGLDAATKQKLKPEVLAAIDLPEAARNEFQAATVFNAFRDQDAGYRERLKRLKDFKTKEPKVPTTLIMKERSERRETFVMIKGDFTRPGERVEPGTPAVLAAFQSMPGPAPYSRTSSGTNQAPIDPRALTRLDLARWLVSAENPLTARVIMNRVWQQYFGKGLVETENDFGLQGSRPSHPELLDWLATEFMARGWSLKAMHRLIVTSSTYRQASAPESVRREGRKGENGPIPTSPRHSALQTPEAIDPQNRLLWRQNRIRLDAELIRDVALAASGLLDPRIGGPPVFPPQPEGLDAFTQNKREWRTSTGPDRYRRGLYTHIQRTRFHPALAVFDAPDSYTTCTRRLRSNTPLQALTLLNDQQFVEFAESLAARTRAQTGSDAAKLEFAFQCCLSRKPKATELERLNRLLSEERRAHQDEAGAWTTVARVLLNLDETVTRE